MPCRFNFNAALNSTIYKVGNRAIVIEGVVTTADQNFNSS
jgi:hypothetical protein